MLIYIPEVTTITFWINNVFAVDMGCFLPTFPTWNNVVLMVSWPGSLRSNILWVVRIDLVVLFNTNNETYLKLYYVQHGSLCGVFPSIYNNWKRINLSFRYRCPPMDIWNSWTWLFKYWNTGGVIPSTFILWTCLHGNCLWNNGSLVPSPGHEIFLAELYCLVWHCEWDVFIISDKGNACISLSLI